MLCTRSMIEFTRSLIDCCRSRRRIFGGLRMFGIPGSEGIDGRDGMKGIDGSDGMKGIDGSDGMEGIKGTDGRRL